MESLVSMFSSISLSLFSETVSLIYPELDDMTELTGEQATGIHVCLPRVGITGACSQPWSSHRFWGPNSCLQLCAASIFLNELPAIKSNFSRTLAPTNLKVESVIRQHLRPIVFPWFTVGCLLAATARVLSKCPDLRLSLFCNCKLSCNYFQWNTSFGTTCICAPRLSSLMSGSRMSCIS